MEELWSFQSCTFDTIAGRKLFEDQNTILELSGRVQELQNEVNCSSDSRIFRMLKQFAVEIPTIPVDQCHSHLIRHLEECFDNFSYRRAAEKDRQAFGTHMVYRQTFLQILLRFPSAHSSRITSMEFVRRAAPFIHSGEKWKTRTRPRSEMPVRTVRQRFSHLQWRRLF